MNFKLLLFVLLISISDLSHALYGARAVTSTQFSSVATIHLNDPENPEYDAFCSGVLIAADKILTTGHCMEVMGTQIYDQWSKFVYEPNLIKIKIGNVKYEVADVTIAESYTEAQGYEGEDLALIKLKKSVTNVAPIKVANKSILKAGMAVTMVAKGKMADTKIINVKNYAGNTVIFTDGTKAGTCDGDSGGALLVKQGESYVLAGILSAQTEDCYKKTGVSIFARSYGW